MERSRKRNFNSSLGKENENENEQRQGTRKRTKTQTFEGEYSNIGSRSQFSRSSRASKSNIPQLRGTSNNYYSNAKGKIPGHVRGALNKGTSFKVPKTPEKEKKSPEENSTVIEKILDEINLMEPTDQSLKSLIEENFGTLKLLTEELRTKKIQQNRSDMRGNIERFKTLVDEFREVLDRWLHASSSFEIDCQKLWGSCLKKNESEKERMGTEHSQALLIAEERNKVFEKDVAEKMKTMEFLQSKLYDYEKQLKDIVEEKEIAVKDCAEQLENQQKESEALKIKFSKLQEDFNIERNINKESNSNFSQMEISLQQAQEKVQNLTKEIECWKDRYDQKQKETASTLENYNLNCQSLRSQVEELRLERKTRIEKLEKAEELKNEILSKNKELEDWERQCNAFKSTQEDLKEQISKLEEAHNKSLDIAHQKVNEINQLKREVDIANSNADFCKRESESIKTNNESLRSALDAQNEQTREMTLKYQTLQDNSGVSNNAQLEKLCKVSLENEELREKLEQATKKTEMATAAQKDMENMKKKIFDAEEKNRKLHNIIQDLKGKIRVFVRVRPSTQETEVCTKIKSDTDIQIQARGSTHSYGFDRVFTPSENQEQVFEEVSLFVQSALHGYNACVIAYGQTGAGKTHTMHGGTGENEGIVKRSVAKIINTSEMMKKTGWTYTFSCNYVEIYNETVKDLLVVNAPKVNIRIVGNEVKLDELNKISFTTSEEIAKIVATAEKRRSVAETTMNSLSSRSHSVFILHLVGYHEETKTELRGCLYLCDLAGSERIKKSNVENERLKETQNINKSLSALTDVFRQLHEKTDHVRFRDSKLTTILQPCFTQAGKALVMVNLAPEVDNNSESLSSLRFAENVSKTELGKTSRNVSKR